MHDFFLLSTARNDVHEAVEWYDDRREGLGEEFFEVFSEKIAIIREFPYLYQAHPSGLRVAPLGHFPYSIYYFVLADQIIVTSCLHHARDVDQILEERT